MKILIMDADPCRLRQLRLILSCLGRRRENVYDAADRKTLCNLLGKKHFECIFLYEKPLSKNAYEVVRLIRQRAPFSSLIVFGPAASRQNVLLALEAGVSAFLTYPFTASGVESVLKSSSSRMSLDISRASPHIPPRPTKP